MNFLRQVFWLLQYLGPGWILFRVGYALRRRSGALHRASAVVGWEAITAQGLKLRPRSVAKDTRRGFACVPEADGVLRGEFRLFSHRVVAAGLPPNWHRNQITGDTAPANRHWTEFGDFTFGDIKGVWELSRFSWAFSLARAFARTGDTRYGNAFWQLVADWRRHNPPNAGPNWMCGQEATFRLMAVAFAAEVVGVPAEEREGLGRFVVVTGRRIAANLDYALSQKNNHGVSECIGLVTAALLAPNDPESAGWRTLGLKKLEAQLAELVYEDGGCSQHSANYHRVLLNDVLWCVTLMQRAGEQPPTWLLKAGQRALAFVDALMDPATGRVPLYGANDGANILPLSDADYLDFRPTVQAGFAVLHGKRRLPEGPWDEMAEWLGAGAAQLSVAGNQLSGKTNSQEPITDKSPDFGRWSHFPDAGCLIWQSDDACLFMRCPTRFRHRPSQADMLHVDIKWRSQPITHDAGTYSYNTTGQFACAMEEAVVHNTVTFDLSEPIKKFGRFLFLPWPRGAAGWSEADKGFTATHDGWRKLGIEHVRRVSSPDANRFVVEDKVTGEGRHTARLHWLLADFPYQFDSAKKRVVLETPAGPFAIRWDTAEATATLLRADPNSARGWWSPYYYHASPALSLAIEFSFTGQTRFETRFGPL